MAEADKATTRLEAAIARNAGWQLQYDMALLVQDRKRLLTRTAELEGNLSAIRSWTRSRQAILADRLSDNPDSLVNAGKTAVLDDLTRVLDHLADPVTDDRHAAPAERDTPAKPDVASNEPEGAR